MSQIGLLKLSQKTWIQLTHLGRLAAFPVTSYLFGRDGALGLAIKLLSQARLRRKMAYNS